MKPSDSPCKKMQTKWGTEWDSTGSRASMPVRNPQIFHPRWYPTSRMHSARRGVPPKVRCHPPRLDFVPSNIWVRPWHHSTQLADRSTKYIAGPCRSRSQSSRRLLCPPVSILIAPPSCQWARRTPDQSWGSTCNNSMLPGPCRRPP